MTPGGALEHYNAAADLLDRNLAADRGERVAIIDRDGAHTYAALGRRVERFAGVLAANGVQMEQRVMLALHDTLDFPTCFLGAIKAGAVPVPVNVLLTSADYAYLLADSRARLLVVQEALLPMFLPVLEAAPFLRKVIVAGEAGQGFERLEDALAAADPAPATAPTRPDDAAFWLYTSGTTGRPKGAVHSQSDLRATALHYALPILDIGADDIVFSVAKLFFAYGLGNALTFPMWVGATAVYMAERPNAAAVRAVCDAHRPTLFFAVPTIYSMMLNNGELPAPEGLRLRRCVSAGEALPENVFSRWRAETGLEILDAVGSTEMLHMFLSNRPGEARPGSSGMPLDGYEVALLDEAGSPVADGELGELFVSGPTAAVGYWNQRAKTLDTFRGRWTKTGDKYYRDAEGYYVYCGRSDDLMKVGGLYVSPMEVENTLLGHERIAECAVVPARDGNDLVKPKAFVVLADGGQGDAALEAEVIEYARARLADYKRPRWVAFIDELPKTATGKIQRYKLSGP